MNSPERERAYELLRLYDETKKRPNFIKKAATDGISSETAHLIWECFDVLEETER